MRALRIAFALLAAGAALIFFGLRARFGGGDAFPDRSGPAQLGADALELVANLDFPPGSIAVSAGGRVFASFRPEAGPPFSVFELRDGAPAPYPPGGLPGGLAYQSVLALRVDRRNRLWVLDHGRHGLGTARLLAFDLATDALVHRHDFPAKIALPGSELADFQVSSDGRHVYVADASLFAQIPAIIDYEVSRQRSRRLLQGHPSVLAEHYLPEVQGVRMEFLGFFALRPNVDSIALDDAGEWLYFAPLTSRWLYRARTADLDDDRLLREELESRVERYAEKTMSDGIAIDPAGSVYLADPEHSAIEA
ncbi:MAG TPA: L-dopachrome tautomerase-related protein, partial [Myxococcota bacterium]|nr:L-dopachrome tautomerase-related protein [Myxococcota bacterium]